MVALRKRGRAFHMDCPLHNRRVRGSLGTNDRAAATRLIQNVELALAEGRDSRLWRDLQVKLPPRTFLALAHEVGIVLVERNAQANTWSGIKSCFLDFVNSRVEIGELSSGTATTYRAAIDSFDRFYAEHPGPITRELFDRYREWRLKNIETIRQGKGKAVTLNLNLSILHRCLSIAINRGLYTKPDGSRPHREDNPVEYSWTQSGSADRGAQPFNQEELAKLRAACKNRDEQMYIEVLRGSGLRRGDAADLRWSEVHFDCPKSGQAEISRITQKSRAKSKQRVYVPIMGDLQALLRTVKEDRKAKPEDHVLLHKNRPMNGLRLYDHLLEIGRRSGIASDHYNPAHPHRFRDTFAVEWLKRRATTDEVARMLGDTPTVVRKHYTPFVPELRESLHALLQAA